MAVVLQAEVVERDESSHHGRQRRRNLRIGGVGVMGLAVHLVLMDLCMEGIAQLGGVAGELDGLLAGIDLDDVESVAAEPGLNRRNVLVGGSELLAEIVRSQPFVVTGRTGGVHLADELAEGGFLAGAALEDQMHAFQRHVIGDGSAVVCRGRQRMHKASESYEPAFDDSRGGRRLLGDRCRTAKQ